MPINGYNQLPNIENRSNLLVGDWVQIKPGSVDITNGTVVTPGSLYSENSSTWGRIERIVDNFPTQGRYNLPDQVRAVQVGNGRGVIMTTVQDINIAPNRVRGDMTRSGLNTLSPLATIISSRDQSLINSTLNALSLVGGNSSSFRKTFTGSLELWNKVLAADNFATSIVNQAENLVDTIGYILTGKKTESITKANSNQAQTFGAGNQIQSWLRGTNLIARDSSTLSNSLFGNNLIGRALNFINSLTGIVDSVMNLIGQGAPVYQSQILNNYNLPVHISSGEITGKFDSTGFKLIGDEQGSYQTGKTQQGQEEVVKIFNTIEEAKLFGSSTASSIKWDDLSKTKQEAKKTNVSQSITSKLNKYRDLTADEKKSIGNISDLKIADNLQYYHFNTFAETSKKQLINDDESLVQNAYGYPTKSNISSLTELQERTEKVLNQNLKSFKPVEYDYQILIDDSTIKSPSGESLEDQLAKFRKSVNLQVHGNKELGRAVNYFLYNRYKTFDGWNMAYQKTFTHVFFTRPDLNLLYNGAEGGANTILPEIKNHSDTFLIWQRNPNLFRLLTDCHRTGEIAPNNFNLFLSQRATNFEFKEESIQKTESSKTWKEYSISYGGSFKGRGAGEFSVTFLETADLAVYDLFRLWMIYIDNVTLGIWRPSYNLYRSTYNSKRVSDLQTEKDEKFVSPFNSHIYTRTLDYASSVYAFKVGPEGEDILYWTKYYGIFPISISASQFQYTAGSPETSPMTVTVTFAYSFKKDLSPVSLLEFNRVAGIKDYDGATSVYEPNLDMQFNTKDSNGQTIIPSGIRSGRPLVGAPFIAIQMTREAIQDSKSLKGLVPMKDSTGKDYEFKLLLKFKPVPNQDNGSDTSDTTFNYDNLYKANSTIRSVNNKTILEKVLDNNKNQSYGYWADKDGNQITNAGTAGAQAGINAGQQSIGQRAAYTGYSIGAVSGTDSIMAEANDYGSISGSVI